MITYTIRSLFAVLLLFTALSIKAEEPECNIALTPDTPPDTVVRTVIEALRSNAEGDDGIATVYCFASPGNRQMTGPIERFTGMIKRGYGDMLNHASSDFDAIEIRDNVAMQPVWLTTAKGNVVGYLFRMGKQSSGKYEGIWMTEAVYRIDPSRRQQSI